MIHYIKILQFLKTSFKTTRIDHGKITCLKFTPSPYSSSTNYLTIMPDNPFRTRQGLIVTTLEKQAEKSNKATKKGILRRVFPFQNGISPWHGAEEDPRYAHLHGG